MCLLQTVYFSFADNVKQPTKLTVEKRAFQRIREVDIAFEELQDALSTGPILYCVQPRERLVVDTDGSNVGTGGVLSQVQGL